MAWVLLLFMYLSYFSGVSSQHTLTQPPSQSVSPGQTVKFSCTISSNKNAFGWLQQRSGQAPQFLFYNNKKGTGVPDRFSVSEAGNTGHLTIADIRAEDEADYYCFMWPSGGSQYVFGGGTQLTVLSQAKSPPTMLLFPPSPKELEAQNKATLVCQVNGFYPAAIQFTWKTDNTVVTDGVQISKPAKQSDNRYLASSYLSLSPDDWKSHEDYTCQVTHEDVNYEASVKRSECP